MSSSSASRRRWLALAVWLAGLLIFGAMALWNLTSFKADGENRLISEAGRAAAQVAGLLSLADSRLDARAALALARAAMEDERVYAIRVSLNNGMTVGQRRNYMWEPVTFDEEIAENCVQGMNSIRVGGRQEGKVDVWLSPRVNDEETALLESRERTRFILTAAVWTLALILIFWHWGEFALWKNAFSARAAQPDGGEEAVTLGLARNADQAQDAGDKEARGMSRGELDDAPLVDGKKGRAFQCARPEAWLVTVGMFRQTFARAPGLINRLYAEGEVAGLCHLGRMLEMAAPCLGARPLEEAARAMQACLNDPSCHARALPVENCATILEKTLDALNGKWRGQLSRPDADREPEKRS